MTSNDRWNQSCYLEQNMETDEFISQQKGNFSQMDVQSQMRHQRLLWKIQSKDCN